MAKAASRKKKHKRGYAFFTPFAKKPFNDNIARTREKSWQQYVLAHSRTIKY